MEENLQEGRVHREERKREAVRLAVEQPAAALVDSGLGNARPSPRSVEEADVRQDRIRRYLAASAAIGAMLSLRYHRDSGPVRNKSRHTRAERSGGGCSFIPNLV